MDLLRTDTESCLITSRIPGEPFGELLAHLTAEGNEIERKEAIASIRDIILQLRSIKNPHASIHPRYMCNASGEALIDPRVRGGMKYLSLQYSIASVPVTALPNFSIEISTMFTSHTVTSTSSTS
jgi:hypothetical protein